MNMRKSLSVLLITMLLFSSTFVWAKPPPEDPIHGLEERVSVLELKVANLTSQTCNCTDYQPQINEILLLLEALSGNITSIYSELDVLYEQLEVLMELNTTVVNNYYTTNVYNCTCPDYSQNITNLQTQIDSLTSELTTIDSRLTTIEEQISSFEEIINLVYELQTNIELLNTTINNLPPTTIINRYYETKDYTEEILQLTTEIEKLKVSLINMNDSIGVTVMHISSLEALYEVLNSVLVNLQITVKTLQIDNDAEHAELLAKIFVLQTTISNLNTLILKVESDYKIEIKKLYIELQLTKLNFETMKAKNVSLEDAIAGIKNMITMLEAILVLLTLLFGTSMYLLKKQIKKV